MCWLCLSPSLSHLSLPLPVCRESMFALRFVLFAINQKNKKKQSEREWEKGEEGQRKIGDKIKKLSMTAALAILFGHLCTVPPTSSFLLFSLSLILCVCLCWFHFIFGLFVAFFFTFPWLAMQTKLTRADGGGTKDVNTTTASLSVRREGGGEQAIGHLGGWSN